MKPPQRDIIEQNTLVWISSRMFSIKKTHESLRKTEGNKAAQKG